MSRDGNQGPGPRAWPVKACCRAGLDLHLARSPKSPFLLSPKTLREREREREKAIRRYVAPVMVVSGSMMLPVSQAPLICTRGASSSHHKKFENSLSTEEEDLVPPMGFS
ncbi:hypothetical protein F2Q69_00060488 [Brassica cretica]|uniref:Uncharacterized protein n=1 Tax=Brassica cretica TaxID=69181 RepID=A0A8S9RE97_BRACR|nr:hypothetical protein F2Q69_00060488 [Brassica cretica]